MNIEKIFNDANNKEICKYVLYTKSQDGIVDITADVYVDKECTKTLSQILTQEIKLIEDEKGFDEFKKNLETIFAKEVTIKAVDEEATTIRTACVIDHVISNDSLTMWYLLVNESNEIACAYYTALFHNIE